jgi:hypothetical protein
MSDRFGVEDTLAIQELIARYALYADEGDHEAVGRLLAHTDLYAQGRLIASSDPALITQRFAATPRPEGVGRRHVTTNVIVTRLGPDLAAATSYFVWTESAPAAPPRMLQCGIYRDRFERVGGEWRFRERRAETDGMARAVPKAGG